jgi:hypothetical protein
MKHSNILYVSLDVYKESIAVAYALRIETAKSSPWGASALVSVTSTN